MSDSSLPSETALGEYLNRARRNRGMSVTDLAKAADFSRGTWYKILYGQMTPSPHTVDAIAAVLGLDPEHARCMAFQTNVTVGRELADLTDNEIVELIAAGAIELRRRAQRDADVPAQSDGTTEQGLVAIPRPA